MPESAKIRKYDLEDRTAKFGEAIIRFAKIVPENNITRPLIQQLVKAATSVGANYCEADCAETRKDFEHKLGICKKEAKETKHFLRMIATAEPNVAERARPLWKECDEIQRIFIVIIKKSKENGRR